MSHRTCQCFINLCSLILFFALYSLHSPHYLLPHLPPLRAPPASPPASPPTLLKLIIYFYYGKYVLFSKSSTSREVVLLRTVYCVSTTSPIRVSGILVSRFVPFLFHIAYHFYSILFFVLFVHCFFTRRTYVCFYTQQN